LIKLEKGFDVYYRLGHYSPELDMEPESQCLTGKLDRNLSLISNATAIEDLNHHRESSEWLQRVYLGPEDARAFLNPAGETMLIYSRIFWEWNGLPVRMGKKNFVSVMLLYNTRSRKKVILIPKGIPLQQQKNWSPIKYIDQDNLLLVYTFEPVLTVIICNVRSGSCGLVDRENDSVQTREGVLRGGTPFYHFKRNYYFGFARVAVEKICTNSVYRPVLIVMEVESPKLISAVFYSQITSFSDKPMHAVKPDWTTQDFCHFEYTLPYSAILDGNEMLVTLNLKDQVNVVVRLSNATTMLEQVIREYEDRGRVPAQFKMSRELVMSAAMGNLVLF